METTTTFPELIRLFLAEDDFRPKASRPHFDGEFIWATDAYILIRLPLSYFPECPTLQDFYDVQSALQKSFFETKPVGKILLSDIEKVLAKMPLYDVYAKCPECKGEGEIECEFCNHSHDCDECLGSGHTQQVIGKEISYGHSVGINHQSFQGKYLLRIAKAMRLLNATEAVFHQGHTKRASTHLVIGDACILLMPNLETPEFRLTTVPL